MGNSNFKTVQIDNMIFLDKVKPMFKNKLVEALVKTIARNREGFQISYKGYIISDLFHAHMGMDDNTGRSRGDLLSLIRAVKTVIDELIDKNFELPKNLSPVYPGIVFEPYLNLCKSSIMRHGLFRNIFLGVELEDLDSFSEFIKLVCLTFKDESSVNAWMVSRPDLPRGFKTLIELNVDYLGFKRIETSNVDPLNIF